MHIINKEIVINLITEQYNIINKSNKNKIPALFERILSQSDTTQISLEITNRTIMYLKFIDETSFDLGDSRSLIIPKELSFTINTKGAVTFDPDFAPLEQNSSMKFFGPKSKWQKLLPTQKDDQISLSLLNHHYALGLGLATDTKNTNKEISPNYV